MTCPNTLTAGTTWEWSISSDTYKPSDGWTCKFVLVGNGQNIAVTVTPDLVADAWTVTHPKASTATVPPGRYEWFANVEQGALEYPLAQGETTVKANPFASLTTSDSRSWAEIALANVREIIKGRATAAILEYEVAGRKLKYWEPEQLIAMQSKLAEQVRADRAKQQLCATGINPARILTRFTAS
jgi:hypothetical protein